MNESEQKLTSLVDSVSAHYDADVFVYRGDIDWESSEMFIDVFDEPRIHPKCLLLLSTFGGDPDAAYRMARCMKRKYSDRGVVIYVWDVCKSAGTLLVLAAYDLIMSDRAELGPLDVQVSQRDEIASRQSGLVPEQALRTLQEQSFEAFRNNLLEIRRLSRYQITTRTAAEIASSLTVGLYAGLHSQLDPLLLGEVYRSMKVAEEYGERIETANVVRGTVDELVSGYPSHSFVIDRDEARNLFVDVDPPIDELLSLPEAIRLTFMEFRYSNEPFVKNLTTYCRSLVKNDDDDVTESTAVHESRDGTLVPTHEQDSAA